MEVTELLHKLSEHHQMRAVWLHLSRVIEQAGNNPAESIPVEQGVNATKVGSGVLEKMKIFVQGKMEEHESEIGKLEKMKVIHIQLKSVGGTGDKATKTGEKSGGKQATRKSSSTGG